jgi:hypothetical protein
MPQYRPGQAATLEAQASSGAGNYKSLITSAAASPTRVNMLDNIITLAPKLQTGPGSGFKAALETTLGQFPGFKGAKDDATAYNEAKKFLEQNALTAWTAAGGTGTNQQLSSIEGANPNLAQDPTTIGALARYTKAGELALQAKATAHTTWLHQPGNNFANQDDFETLWRKNFDPVLFQLKTSTPEAAGQLLHGLPQARLDDLGAKQKWLQTEGVY